MTTQPEEPAPDSRHPASNSLNKVATAISGAATALILWVIRFLPAPVRRRVETEAGTRFLRFAPTALIAVLTSQVTLAVLTGWFLVSAGRAALVASVVASFVSYVLSRWAWESKGRPDLLRETVPFWLVSFAAWGVLSVATHYAGSWAIHEQLHHLMRHLVVNGAYLAANCVTFVSRFLIFHYVLFAKQRGTVGGRAAAASEAADNPPVAAAPEVAPVVVPSGGQDQVRMALTGDRGKRAKPSA